MDHSDGPNPRVIQDSPGVEEQKNSRSDEHQPNNALLDVPPINVIAGNPPLLIRDAAAIVGQNKATEDTTPSDDDELPLDSNAISLADVTSINTEEQQNDTVRRQGSERRSRSPYTGSGSRRRTKISDRPSSNNSVTRRMPKSSSSARISRKSMDFSSMSASQSIKLTARPKSPEQRNISVNQSSVNNNSSDSEEEQTVLSSAAAHRKTDHEARSVASSNSSLSSMPEERHTAAVDQPPCTIGEKIMVETPNGFKFGKVKFIGPTEFAAGEWIGLALERPTGE